uniref:NADH:quinone oxidoreductase/Mrp antiporter membrane subunit domain-containing protein n=1 Tax=Triticum aestivum TaxID=4565 RepID=A0A3B5ZTT9_WHEAT
MREDPGPEQVGLGYRAVSAVGVTEDVLVRFIVGYDILMDCWERPLYSKYAFLGALRSAAQMVPYEVSIGLILIVGLVSTFGSAKAIARIFP